MKDSNYLVTILKLCLVISSVFFSCEMNNELNPKTAQGDTLFTLMSSEEMGVRFSNKIKETLHFNFINYPYVYNGGGVSVGDINNDGLIDLTSPPIKALINFISIKAILNLKT